MRYVRQLFLICFTPLFLGFSFSSTGQSRLEISGFFLNGSGIDSVEFGSVTSSVKETTIGIFPVLNNTFKAIVDANGYETYFLKSKRNIAYFDLGPGIANINFKDSTLLAVITKNVAHDEFLRYINHLRNDTNFTNVRKARFYLEDYQRQKNVDSSTLKQKEQAYLAAESLSTQTEMAFAKKWFEDNPNAPENTKILYSLIKTAPESFIKDNFKRMPESFKKSISASQITYWRDSISIGGIFPVSVFFDPNHERSSINKKFRDNTFTLVDFWASWCIPCRMEMPLLGSIYAKYNKSKFNLISISIDQDQNAWLNAFKTGNYYWSQFSGNNRQVMDKYILSSIPANFLVNNEGRVIARNLSAAELDIFLGKKLKKSNGK